MRQTRRGLNRPLTSTDRVISSKKARSRQDGCAFFVGQRHVDGVLLAPWVWCARAATTTRSRRTVDLVHTPNLPDRHLARN